MDILYLTCFQANLTWDHASCKSFWTWASEISEGAVGIMCLHFISSQWFADSLLIRWFLTKCCINLLFQLLLLIYCKESRWTLAGEFPTRFLLGGHTSDWGVSIMLYHVISNVTLWSVVTSIYFVGLGVLGCPFFRRLSASWIPKVDEYQTPPAMDSELHIDNVEMRGSRVETRRHRNS